MSGFRTIGVNAAGLRVGEHHHNAKLTDHDVDLIRRLHEDEGMSYRVLARKFEVSKGAIAGICRYERRAQTVERFREVRVLD